VSDRVGEVRRHRIVHKTSIGYDSRATASYNELRMTPLNEVGQTTLENRIRIRPMTWSHVYRDHWGTHVMAMESLAEHQRLDIEAISTVERTEVERHEPSLDWKAVRDPAVQDRSYEWLQRKFGPNTTFINPPTNDLPPGNG